MGIKSWWAWNRPKLTNARKLFSQLTKCSIDIEKLHDQLTWSALRPIISDLEELKKNTWDKDRVNNIQKYLIENFKEQDDD